MPGKLEIMRALREGLDFGVRVSLVSSTLGWSCPRSRVELAQAAAFPLTELPLAPATALTARHYLPPFTAPNGESVSAATCHRPDLLHRKVTEESESTRI